MHANLYKSGRGEFILVTDKKAMEWVITFQMEDYTAIETHIVVLDEKIQKE